MTYWFSLDRVPSFIINSYVLFNFIASIGAPVWGSAVFLYLHISAFVEDREASAAAANFGGLVLGCMDSYDSDQRLILQGFLRSTRLAFLCTAPISNLQSFAPLIFAILLVIFANLFLLKFWSNPSFFAAIFTEFCRNCGKSQILFKILCILQIASSRILEKCLRSYDKFCKILLKNRHAGWLSIKWTLLPVES